jgi:crotonobetainyl-CoA:carnitine CoA-transferase CaiB-like acyl-CoA transferase
VAQALAMPVVKERALFVSPERFGWPGGLPLLRLPIDADGSGIARRPPSFGEHTEEVLREAGLDAALIYRLTKG